MMRPLISVNIRSLIFAGVLLIAGGALAGASPAQAAPAVLEVTINSIATGLIEEFDDRDGDIYAKPDVLRRIGIRFEGVDGAAAGAVRLATIPDLKYTVDRRRQALDIQVAPARLTSRTVDLGRYAPGKIRPTAGTGGVFNYDVYADSTWGTGMRKRADNLSFFGNPRIFSPYGVVSGSFVASPTTRFGTSHVRRLETSWSYGDPDSLIRYSAGDLVSSGVAWSRPVYMGGMQVITDFAMRPDLLITPIPLITGVANAPSTVDVLVNGVRQSTQTVGQGPFTINNLPVVTGRGDVTLVVRDALGRETAQTFPYYVSGMMLTQGLTAFGAEAGYLRRGYVGADVRYGVPAAGATVRHGFTHWATGEIHVEGARDVQNGGVGAIVALGDIGQINLAGIASRSGNGIGYQWFGAFERNLWTRSSNFFVSAQQASAKYADLATLLGGKPILHQYRMGVSFAPFGWGETLGFAVTDTKTQGSERFRLGSSSLGFPVMTGVTSTLSGYKSMGPSRWAALLTVSFRLGGRTSGLFTAGTEQGGQRHATMDLYSYPDQESNGIGWHIAGGWETGTMRFAADGTYLTPFAAVNAGVARSGGVNGVRADVSGAIVVLDGLYFARDIYDGFAVVDAGAANVGVLRGNVPVGTTDASGRLLVRNLVAYNPNKISLDPNSMPSDVDVEKSDIVVSPMDRSGVAVKFDARKASASVLAKILLADGSLAPVGAELVPVGGGPPIMIGYDGMAYFKNIGEARAYELRGGPQKCRVSVSVSTEKGQIPPTRELRCQ